MNLHAPRTTPCTLARRAALLAAAGVLAAALTGCAGEAAAGSAEAEAARPVNTVVAVGTGARANTPALTSLPSELTGAIEETISSGGAFDVLVIDGDPQVIGGAVLASTAETAARRAQENASSAAAAAQLVLDARAEDPEADVFAALEAGAADLRSFAADLPDAENHLYLVDSCVGTTGLLDYTGVTGMTLASDPAEVAAFVTQQADLDLTGITVHVLFAGEVESPQETLSRTDRANVIAALETVVTSAGGAFVASDAQLPAAETASATDSLPSVTACPVSAAATFSASESTVEDEYVFENPADVRFIADTATFADEDAARRAIDTVAADVCQSGSSIQVVGSCATAGSEAQRTALAQARAQVVADELVAAGVPASQIAAVTGVPDGFVADRLSNGELVEDAAAQNRAVRIVPA